MWPWDSRGTGGPGRPMNALTGRRYSGINVLLLWGAAIGGAYPSQHWLTFKQALEAGGNVRTGEKGTLVVYADRFVPEAAQTKARETGAAAKAVPFLNRFTVFNVSHCVGLVHETLTAQPRLPTPLPNSQK